MNTKWKNESFSYNKEHSKFYLYIIYPTLIAMIILVIFLFLGKKEIVVNLAGKLNPKTISNIQITQDEKIIINNLIENKSIKKGDLLIKFDSTKLDEKKTELSLFNEKLSIQKDLLELLKKSLTEEINYFTSQDIYGYSNIISAFLIEKEIKLNEVNAIKIAQEFDNNIENNLNQILTNQINSKKKEYEDTKELRENISISAINFKTENEEINKLFTIYSERIKLAGGEEKEQEKNMIVAELTNKLENLSIDINNLELEKVKSSNINFDKNNEEILSITNSIELLKQQNLIEIANKKTILETEFSEKNIELVELNKAIEDLEIIAESSGILKINNQLKNTNYIPKGTNVAEIIPEVTIENLEINTLISTEDIGNVKKGMPFYFKTINKGKGKKSLSGKIVSISKRSIKVNDSEFYEATGEIISNPNIEELYYDLSGEISIIVGKKSYFNYLKDVLLKS
ncbi:bacteriocin secretion accessory protein [Carnobacterium maltaromaticum]|uniref:bacteriocin secretion accessory protein n=1 Tax=Carnobacterium maltaromaticum TaxID=2751 RepID=UPI0039BEB866